MKLFTSLLFMITALISVNASADDTTYAASLAHVTSFTLMGERWQNANRGGFYFYTDNMPALPTSPYNVDYFIVRGTEKYVNRLLSVVLAAKNMNKRIAVGYMVLHPDNPEAIEGDVVSIAVE